MRRAVCILSLACFLPAIGQAQQHAGMAMPGVRFLPAPVSAPRVSSIHTAAAARPAAHLGRSSARLSVAPKPTAHPVGWNHGNHGSNAPADPVFPNGNPAVNGYPVPGLGFDYTHYFAVHPNAGRCHRCQDNGFFPFVGGGVYFPTPMYLDQSAEAQPAAEEVPPTEQAAQGEEPPPQPPPDAYSPPLRSAPQPAPKPQAEYVFVRRDGTLVFAVAYSWINDRLQYVTSEGLRRTIAIDTIDLGATQQFNEQRGVPIQPPV